jgi:hypothetical protein
LLGLTDNTQYYAILKETDAPKLLVRLLEADDLNGEEVNLTLSFLVNLTSQETFHGYFLKINTVLRLTKLFLSKVDKEIKYQAPTLNEDNLFSLDLDLGLLGEELLVTSNSNYGNSGKKQNIEVKKGNFFY